MVNYPRRMWLKLTGSQLVVTSKILSAPNGLAARPVATDRKLDWHDVEEWGVEGKGWRATERFYDRLPARAQPTVRPAVWNLSRQSAGMMVQFQTDATEISIDYRVISPGLAMPHMPATGVSGVDLYARFHADSSSDARRPFQWVAVTRPVKQQTTGVLVRDLAPGLKTFRAYLPLYNGVKFLRFGVPAGAAFERLPPRSTPPIVFYGTSITQGACASRPGMPHPAILGRRLDRPIINLGFSGNGKMEKAIGDLLVELDAACYVIDCLPNMGPDEVAQRTEPLVLQLKQAHPDTPILLVEDRSYGSAWIKPGLARRNRGNRLALRQAYENLLRQGLRGLRYVAGDSLLGADCEATTDGSHPSDLGFVRQADALEPHLRDLLSDA